MSDEQNRVTPQESDEYDPPKAKDADRITSLESEDYDRINPEPKHSKYWYDYDRNDPDRPNPFSTDPLADNDDQIAHHVNATDEDLFASMDGVDFSLGGTNHYASAVDFQVENMVGAAETINIDTSGFDLYGKDVVTFGTDTSPLEDAKAKSALFASNDGVEFTLPVTTPFLGGEDKPKPDLKNPSTHKYQEDKGIEDLKSYVTSTYTGHYTNNNSDTQTLDLIHSVGDAESFCRSNAIKYLSRYDKKGSAKQDILKAMHYCLLLYYFSGNTKEPDYTNTRYETF